MENLIRRFENSFKANRDLPALTDYASGKTYSYLQLAAKIESNHRIFSEEGIKKGDKIALVGKNSIDWISTYISVITYGAVAVPILPDFNPIDIKDIVSHSDSVLLFADSAILRRMDTSELTQIRRIFRFEDMSEPDPIGFDIDRVKYADVEFDSPVIISYTSGTTGSSKGVILPLRSLSSNVDYAITYRFHIRGSRVLALLPLAHAYGCAFDMLTPLSVGSHVFVLGKMPTPGVLLEALGKVKPRLICTVPLVMEKLVRKNVMPQLEKQPVKTLLKLPLINRIIYAGVRKKLLAAFGGCITEINMGGAALAPDVEKLLTKIRFPFAVGYGMTECGPLISYCGCREFKSGSCGRLVTGMEIKVDTEGFENGLGEICVKGDNLLLGYYKNPEATENAIRDGWFHTGDIGYVDKDNMVFLRGRCKSMILTSAGQNIYPEEIEGKLNHLAGVSESLVYEKDGKLIALVVPDAEMMKQGYEKIKEYSKSLLGKLNSIVAPFEKISDIRACSEPFEKTPKQSIKRFLYPKKAKFFKE